MLFPQQTVAGVSFTLITLCALCCWLLLFFTKVQSDTDSGRYVDGLQESSVTGHYPSLHVDKPAEKWTLLAVVHLVWYVGTSGKMQMGGKKGGTG